MRKEVITSQLECNAPIGEIEANVITKLLEEDKKVWEAVTLAEYEQLGDTALTLEEYRTETRVVVEVTEEHPEQTELVRPYIPTEVTEEMVLIELEKYHPEYADMLKARKMSAIEGISVVHHDVEYDGHTRARSDMGIIVALANFKMIQEMVSILPEFQPVYDAIYKVSIDWKGKDNTTHTVQRESVAETLESAMQEYAKQLGV